MMDNSNKPGFILPSAQTSYPQYPAYPTQQHAPYPYPQQHAPPPAYQHQPFPAPIQQQPGFGGPPQGGMQWSEPLHSQLRNASSFHVKQKIELLEALVGLETENKYTVKDQAGNKILYVAEQSNCCGRQCCGKLRPFTLLVKDTNGRDILTFDRPLNCTCCCGLCCPDKLTVATSSGHTLGIVEEECNLLYPKFKLSDATGRTVLKIEGPFCPMSIFCGQAVFRLTTPDGISVGTISKEWSGLVRELFTDADYFSMSFPPNLDPSMKFICLAALFLIDYEYFEHGPIDDQQGGRRLFG